MANPQPSDAHLRVAHSINEAIMTRDFTKRQRKILDLILRLSWGCGKKDAYIPHQADFRVVGVHEVDIKHELDWLTVSKVITREDQFYWFNKDFDQWEVSRVKPYLPEKLSELLTLNLNGNRPEVSKTLTEVSKTLTSGLVKHEGKGYLFTNFPTPNLASSKERKESIKESNIYINYEDLILTFAPEKLSELLSMARDIWGKVRVEVKKKVNVANFETWIAPTSGVALEAGKFWLAVPSVFVAEWLAKNQRSLIEKVLTEVIGADVELALCIGPVGVLSRGNEQGRCIPYGF